MMDEQKRDKTKVALTTGAEEAEPARPLETVPEGQPANATTAMAATMSHFMRAEPASGRADG